MSPQIAFVTRPATRAKPVFAALLALALLGGACSGDDEPPGDASPAGPVASDGDPCARLGDLEAATEDVSAPGLFELDADGLAERLDRQRQVLAEVASRADGTLGELLDQQLENEAALDQALVEVWDRERDELRDLGGDWVAEAVDHAVRRADGEEVPITAVNALSARTHELLVVRCRAPELAGGPRQETTEEPPAGVIEFQRLDPAGGQRFAIEPTGGSERALPSPEGWSLLSMPDASPDQDRLAVRAEGADGFGLLVLDRDGQVVQTLQSGSTPFSCPAWAPDGSAVLALVDARDDEARGLHVFGLDGSIRRVELPFAAVGCADWVGPDRLVVSDVVRDEGGDAGLWLVDLDGSDAEPLYQPEDCTSLLGGVDPGGTRAVLTMGCEDPLHSGLWIVDLATGDAQHLVTGKVAVPDWSPDGRWLALGFANLGEDTSTDLGIWLVRDDGRQLRELAGPAASFPVWMPRA